jgi:hypothetical protein
LGQKQEAPIERDDKKILWWRWETVYKEEILAADQPVAISARESR